jgi:hypothetical protein
MSRPTDERSLPADERRRPAEERRGMDAKALARARGDALRVRTRRIRRSVAGLTVTLFVLVFGIVYVQLASGHDPALVARKTSSTAEAGTREATGATEATGSTEASSASGAGEEASSPSAVTTSQS